MNIVIPGRNPAGRPTPRTVGPRRAVVLTWLVLMASGAQAIMERGEYPWDVELRSFFDRKGPKCDGEKIPWLLNLGPTGIRARIYPDKPKLLVVKYVFEDAKCPAKGKIEIEDVIAGANGKTFKTPHRFGRNLPGGGGWDGPMMELAEHIEDSQGKDGVLSLMVWPKGDDSRERTVKIQLKVMGRFSKTFPYDCPRSEKLLEELCDFMVMDYESGNWKSANSFYGAHHGQAHQLLALMASGIPKYESLITKTVSGYYGNRYDPEGGGFQMWKWGFDGIVMGEAYHLYKDKKLLPAIKSLEEAVAWGSFNRNGIYTHRPYLNIKRRGGKPYASMAAISGLDMIAMSLFKAQGLPYDEELYETIHQLYLGSTAPEAVNIAYAFGSSNKENEGSNGRDERHVYVKLKDATKGLSGKGPGYICPTGMKGIGPYEIIWPTKADPRYKPTDWVEKEASENIVEEEVEAFRTIHRYTGKPTYKEPTSHYKTSRSGGHLAPVGMGALAHLIGNKDNKSWTYLGLHAANTCVLGPGNAFDGHAASNLHAFWSVLGAARSDQPEKLRAYFDYMKTFLILSECHNGGLYLQPWGRDRPGCNSDPAYGPRILPTATGAILLSLPQKRLLITGADDSAGAGKTAKAKTSSKGSKTSKTTTAVSPSPPPKKEPVPLRQARTMAGKNLAALDTALKGALAKLSGDNELKQVPLKISKTQLTVCLKSAAADGTCLFQPPGGTQTAEFKWDDLSARDHATLAQLVASLKPASTDAQAMAGVYLELNGMVKDADQYFGKAGAESTKKLEGLFDPPAAAPAP